MDHKVAQANVGSGNLRNLRPLNSRDNSSKGKRLIKVLAKLEHLAVHRRALAAWRSPDSEMHRLWKYLRDHGRAASVPI